LLRPERVGDPEFVRSLESWEPDLGVVVAFGQFLPKRIRELPRLGYLINAHASLLPKYRGAAPIAHAVLAGESQTGISVMRVEKEMDAGPVALARSLEIGKAENAGELAARLGELAADAIEAAVDAIATGEVSWTDQDPDCATQAPRLGRNDAVLDWREDAEALARRVRAMAPKPGASTTLDGEALRILEARPHPSEGSGQRNSEGDSHPLPPGSVRIGGDTTLAVATGKGWLEVLRLQRPGGKALDADAFLRGRPIADETVLGAREASD
jgi:methionyl-tRNA formyltransferase